MMLKEKTARVIDAPEQSAALHSAAPCKANLFICALAGFLAARAHVGGSGAPVNVSLTAALSPIQGLAALIGSVTALFLSGTVGESVTEIIAALGIILLKTALVMLGKKSNAAFLSLWAGAVYLVCGLTVSLFFRLTAPLAMAVTFRAALCFITAYFIFEVLCEVEKNGAVPVNGEKSVAAAVVFILVLCALASAGAGYFNLGRAFGAFVLLAFASKYGAAAGAAAGALTSLGLTLSSYDLGRSAVMLACAGLLAGVFSSHGKLTVSVVFIMTNLIGAVVTGLPAGVERLAADAAAAAVLFALLPERFYISLLGGGARKPSGSVAPRKLEFAASAISDVRGAAAQAAEVLCAENKANVHSANVVHAGDLREASLNQLHAAEVLLNNFTPPFEYRDDKTAQGVKNLLKKRGAQNPSVSVYCDGDGRMYIECFYEKGAALDVQAVTNDISRLTSLETAPPDILASGGLTRLRVHEIPALSADVGTAGKSGREDEISGDSEHFFTDGFGGMFFILSDGMGTGKRAAVESRMTASILTKLLKAGIDAAASLKMLNLIMLAKSSDETFATVDLLRLNLFSGKTDIIKSGAAPTLVKTGGSVKTVESRTPPVGIMPSVEFEKQTVRLKSGDCVVMLTDGVSEFCLPKIKDLMLAQGIGAEYIAREIIKHACENDGAYADDKTVIVIKIK